MGPSEAGRAADLACAPDFPDYLVSLPPAGPRGRVVLQLGTQEWGMPAVPWSGYRSGEIRMTSTAGPTTVAAVMHQQLFFL